MIAWRSLEARLTVWYSLMLFLGYSVFGVAVWLAVRYAVRSAVDDLLIDRLERLVEVVAMDADGPEEVEEELVEYVMALPESRLAQVRDDRGNRIFPFEGSPSAAPQWERGEEDGAFRTGQWEGIPYRVLTQKISILGRSYEVSLASSLQSLMLLRKSLAAFFLWAAPLAFVLCSGGGLYIARQALKPLDQIAETTAGITVGSLSSRIPVPATRDALERLALTFNEMLERLDTSVRRIEQFSADASHELRTPLTVIRTTAELALRHGRTADEYRGDLKDIHAEAVRLSELVEVLLALSREGVERRLVAMFEIDLLDLATGVCQQFRKQAESKGLSLTLEGPGHPVLVMGNDPSLRRLIESLLENALAHTQRGGITVSIRDNDAPELSVSDTGEGIPEEILGKIFDRFYRANSSRNRATAGHGLGLSIALAIAKLHDAELKAESRLGQGSRFTVRFLRKGRGQG